MNGIEEWTSEEKSLPKIVSRNVKPELVLNSKSPLSKSNSKQLILPLIAEAAVGISGTDASVLKTE
jgi:hypothetical protein